MKYEKHGHGRPRSPEYTAYINMLQRCHNPKRSMFHA